MQYNTALTRPHYQALREHPAKFGSEVHGEELKALLRDHGYDRAVITRSAATYR
jgi:hypothetical protein